MALGRIAHAITFTDDVTTVGSATQLYPLGTLRMEETSLTVGVECYRYIKHNKGAGSVATALGALGYRNKTVGSPWSILSDVSDTASGHAVGVYQSVVTDLTFAWVKTKGFQATLRKAQGSALNWTNGAVLVAAPNASQDGMTKIVTVTTASKVCTGNLKAALQRIVGWAASTALSGTAVGKAYIDLE